MLARLGATALACVVAVIALSARAVAHGVGMSRLRLRVQGAAISGEWEIHLADARSAVHLDPAVVGEAGWLDLSAHEAALRAYVGRQLTLTLDDVPCTITVASAPMEWQSETSQVVLHVAAVGASEPTRLGLRCDMLFDLDATHRAYFSIEDARVVNVGVFRQDVRSIAVDVRQFHFWTGVGEFIR